VRGTQSHDVKVDDGKVWVRLRSGKRGDGPAAHGLGSIALPTTAAAPLPLAAAAPAAGTTSEAPAPEAAPPVSAILCEDSVREILKEVTDPELFVNIVDLGLIYGVTLSPAADAPDKQHVSVDMTMTSPACPAGPQLIADTKRAVGSRDSIAAVEVRIVMDPPWTPDRMTDAARDQLGIF
jgi:metal-sulfur cluster biosynthetic enzyme